MNENIFYELPRFDPSFNLMLVVGIHIWYVIKVKVKDLLRVQISTLSMFLGLYLSPWRG
jgi:hypothetical protein